MARCPAFENRAAREPSSVPIPVVYEGGTGDGSQGVDDALRRSVERGEYVVDSRAVARAILRSSVLVAAQTRHGAVRSEKNQSATG
jgi:hypothetical protein